MDGWKGVEGWGRRAILPGWPLRILSLASTTEPSPFSLSPSSRRNDLSGVSHDRTPLFLIWGVYFPRKAWYNR